MSDYPEHAKLSAISDQSQAIGEFADWLGSKRIHLMTWREDLTDTRTVDPTCQSRRDRHVHADACKPRWVDGGYVGGVFYQMQHCTHWTDKEKDCCLCGSGQFREVTGIKSWVDAPQISDLLAEFFEIDQNKLEAEKREMLRRLSESAA